MKCCKKELENPDVIDGTAYFVCTECGELYEIKDYREYSAKESLCYFKERCGFELPKEYILFQEVENGMVFKIPRSDNRLLKRYFGEGFYTTGNIASIDPNADYSIYDSASSGWDWGLPEDCIAIEGDGHTWLALNYRASSKNPSVVVFETDGGNSLVVAKSFKEFMSGLLPYEDVYDRDGNVIYRERST